MSTNFFHVVILVCVVFPCNCVLADEQGNKTEGLKCFVCNSAFDENCSDSPPPKKYLVECSDLSAKPMSHDGVSITIMDAFISSHQGDLFSQDRNYTLCRKEYAEIPEQRNEDFKKPATTRIVRSCGWSGPEKDNCKVISREVIILKHCACLEDGCNSAPIKKVRLVPMMLLLALARKLSH